MRDDSLDTVFEQQLGPPTLPLFELRVRKQSGMFWSSPGAEHILAFRCIHQSRRLDGFWKDRLNDLAARNDALTLAA